MDYIWANWFKEIVDGETHTLEAPPTNKLTPDGWVMNYNRNAEAMTSDGFREWTDAELEEWHAQYDPPAPVYIRQRCTKYQLVTCLRNFFPALLPTLRAAYAASADLQFYWNTVLNLDRTNADFVEAVTALGITEEQIASIFEKIDGEEPMA